MHSDNFSKQADLYARYRPAYPETMYRFIFEQVDHKGRAWDCATGSGQVARRLADEFERVYASDISTEQMAHAPERKNIAYFHTAAEEVDFDDAQFDLITVAQAIHWFNMDRFYAEVRRTAAPGGVLAVIGYGMIRVNEQINPLIDEFYNYAFGEFFGENRRYLDDAYQTIPFPFDEIDSPSFEQSYRWSRQHLEGYFNSWSAVQKIKERDGLNPVDEVIQQLAEKWEPDEFKTVNFPIFLRAGYVHKNHA